MSGGGNRSTAVMQRRVEAHDSLDDFPTPPWATRAVLEWLGGAAMIDPTMAVREPCANRGYMVRPLAEYFSAVDAADVHDYGAGFPVRDYLFGEDPEPVDWTFMNPPFRLGEEFIARALRTSRVGVAAIVRTAFLEGEDRFTRLFGGSPPSMVLIHSERVVMLRGRLVRAGAVDPFNPKPGTKASTATSYCWLIWRCDFTGGMPSLDWLPPCRRQLELPGDYPDYSQAAPVGCLFSDNDGEVA